MATATSSMGRKGQPEGAVGFRGLLVVWFLNGCLLAPLSTQLPVYVESALHRPPIYTAMLQTVQLGAAGIAAILGGILADSWGTKVTLLIGLTGAAALSIQFHASWIFVMIAIAVYAGAASGMQSVGAQAYLLAALQGKRLGMGSAAFFLGNTLGSSAGNLLTGRALDAVGFPVVATIIGVASFGLVAATAVSLPTVARTPSRVRLSSLLAGYGRLLSRGDVRLLCALRYATTCFWGAATLLMPLLIFRESGSKGMAGTYAAASLVVAATCQLAIGRISDRIGRRGPTIVLTILIPSSALITGRASGSLAGLFAGGILGAASAWSLSTLMPGLIDDLSTTEEKGRLVGLMHATWSCAMLSGSLLGGALVGLDRALPFYVVGAANLGSIGMAYALLRRGAQTVALPAEPVAASNVSPRSLGA